MNYGFVGRIVHNVEVAGEKWLVLIPERTLKVIFGTYQPEADEFDGWAREHGPHVFGRAIADARQLGREAVVEVSHL